jgi:NADPH2:quinone reductase
VPIPDEISDEQAATLSISYLTAWNIFKKLQLKKDDTLLVYGATGGLGMAVIQIAKALGIKIITSVSDDSKFNFARSLGSDNVINREKKEVALEVEKITGGLGVDCVVDNAGQKTIATSINCVRKGGKNGIMWYHIRKYCKFSNQNFLFKANPVIWHFNRLKIRVVRIN